MGTFKVRDKVTEEIFTVYAVSTEKSDTYFLVWLKKYERWKWLLAEEFEPYVEER